MVHGEKEGGGGREVVLYLNLKNSKKVNKRYYDIYLPISFNFCYRLVSISCYHGSHCCYGNRYSKSYPVPQPG